MEDNLSYLEMEDDLIISEWKMTQLFSYMEDNLNI